MNKIQPRSWMHWISQRILIDSWSIAIAASAVAFVFVLLWLAWSSGYWVILLLIVPAAGFVLHFLLVRGDDYNRKRGDDLYFDS